MSNQAERMGGRLPLLNPATMSAAQKEAYDRLNKTMIQWADSAQFQSKTDDGRLIGPFNPELYNPGIGAAFWIYTMLKRSIRRSASEFARW